MAQAWRRLLLSRAAAQLRSSAAPAAAPPARDSTPGILASRSHGASRLMACRFFNTGEGGKLFVGGISFNTSEDSLRDGAWGGNGRQDHHRETRQSRGFGFVTYYKEEDADTALSKLNGHTLDGRVIRVDRASSRPARPMGGGFGGGDGGYGGGSGGGGFSGGFNDSEPAAAEEDWGSLHSLNVDAVSSQN